MKEVVAIFGSLGSKLGVFWVFMSFNQYLPNHFYCIGFTMLCILYLEIVVSSCMQGLIDALIEHVRSVSLRKGCFADLLLNSIDPETGGIVIADS